MEIVWKNNRIKSKVENIARSNATSRKRMAQLVNAPCFLDIPTNAHAHFLKGEWNGCFAVDFDYPARLICEPVGEFKMENGQFIKETITAIEIISIESDYHKK